MNSQDAPQRFVSTRRRGYSESENSPGHNIYSNSPPHGSPSRRLVGSLIDKIMLKPRRFSTTPILEPLHNEETLNSDLGFPPTESERPPDIFLPFGKTPPRSNYEMETFRQRIHSEAATTGHSYKNCILPHSLIPHSNSISKSPAFGGSSQGLLIVFPSPQQHLDPISPFPSPSMRQNSGLFSATSNGLPYDDSFNSILSQDSIKENSSSEDSSTNNNLKESPDSLNGMLGCTNGEKKKNTITQFIKSTMTGRRNRASSLVS
uniref:Uncharacterized protein n=1 Tax=Rhabditophanes sp. KR3021 TaxID=114890 RepID=A0AC35TSC3_9BILA